MKVIGRKILTEADIDVAARRRFALWVKQLTEAHWDSPNSVMVGFPNARVLGASRLVFPFAQFGFAVTALLSFDLGIMCIEEIVELDMNKK